MSWKDKIPSSIKDAIFEEEPDAKKPDPVRPPLAQPQIHVPFQADPLPTPAYTSPVAESADSESMSVFAERLKAKTDFDATPVGQQVNEHLVPLDGLPLTEMQKMSAVLKGGAKEGLTGEKIIATLQGLLGVLNTEQEAFHKSVAAATASEVETREKAIQDEVAHAKSLEDQISVSRQKRRPKPLDGATFVIQVLPSRKGGRRDRHCWRGLLQSLFWRSASTTPSEC